MKRFLNKNIKIVVTVFAIVLSITVSSPSAQARSKVEYYKRLFGEKFGFTLYEEDIDIASNEDYLSNNPKKGYLILLSSDVSQDKSLDLYFEENKKIVLICDDTFINKKPLNFSCDKLNVYSESEFLENTGGFLKTTNLKESLYVIPENLLVSTEGMSMVEDYFRAVRRSDEALDSLEDIEDSVSTGEALKDALITISRTSAFEAFSIALSMFVLVSVFYGLLKFLSKEDKKKFNFKVLKNTLSKVSSYFQSSQGTMIYVFVVSLVIYIPIIVVLGVRDGQGISLGYFTNYSLDTFKISNLIGYIDQGVYFRIMIFFYNFIFLIIVFTLLIPSLIKIILAASSKIEVSKLKPEAVKYLMPGIVVTLILVLSLLKISESHGFLISAVVLLVFIIVKNTKNKTFDYKYSSREKSAFLIISLLIIAAGFLMKVRESKAGPNYREEDLIGVSDDVVMIPYSKQVGEDFLFHDYFVSFPEPLFVDQYLVYSPNGSRVENKNISEFKNSGSFYIQNGTVEEIISSIYSSGQLLDVLISQSPTTLFKINKFEDGVYTRDVKMQITFSCEREDLGVDKIKSEFYYLSQGGEVQKSDETLLYFPGCSKAGNPETFTVEFNPPYADTDYLFVLLPGILDSDIDSIKILSSNEIIDPVYYSKKDGFSIIAAGGQTDSSRSMVTNYIFGDSYSLSFNMDFDSEGGFNISEPINELIREGILKDRFLIWSTRKYIPIRLD